MVFALLTVADGFGDWGGDFNSRPTSNVPVLPKPKVVWWRNHGDAPSGMRGLPVNDSSLPEQCRGIPLIKGDPMCGPVAGKFGLINPSKNAFASGFWR